MSETEIKETLVAKVQFAIEQFIVERRAYNDRYGGILLTDEVMASSACGEAVKRVFTHPKDRPSHSQHP